MRTLRGSPAKPVCIAAALLSMVNGVFAQDSPPPPLPGPPAPRYGPDVHPPAPEKPLEGDMPPGLSERALVFNVSTRLHDGSGHETWVSDGSKITLPGRPVGIKLIGDNIACAVQFTPYIRGVGDVILVAQGQIWIKLPGGRMRYETIVKTIPIQFGEQVYFFPLGKETQDGSRLEICLDMKPYSKTPNFERAPRDRDRDASRERDRDRDAPREHDRDRDRDRPPAERPQMPESDGQ